MRHRWIIDVLTDLRAYAELNNLSATARAAEQTLDVAMAEISALQNVAGKPNPKDGHAE